MSTRLKMGKTLSKIIFTLFGAVLFFTSCRKEQFSPEPADPCLEQTANPAGHSYSTDSLLQFSYSKKHCGLLPLSTKNYWVYEDSIFFDGDFVKVQLDTLRFAPWKSLEDGLVWWEGNVFVGLPEKLYANDSSLFLLENRLFIPGILDAKKSYSLFPGDSLKYFTSFGDIAALGRSVYAQGPQTTPAGNFSDCLLFEKEARNYRKEQLIFKPGLGVIKFTQEIAPMGTRILKLQQVSSLVAFHIE